MFVQSLIYRESTDIGDDMNTWQQALGSFVADNVSFKSECSGCGVYRVKSRLAEGVNRKCERVVLWRNILPFNGRNWVTPS